LTAKDIQEIYAKYDEFKKETGSKATLDAFKRNVRKAFYHGKVAVDGVRVMQESVGPNLNIVTESHSIRTLEQLLAYCKVDLGMWNVDKHVVNMWGSSSNSNFQVKAWLSRKEELTDEEEINTLIMDAKKYAPKYPKIHKSRRNAGENVLEISLFDHHYGQLSWGPETMSASYDAKIAGKLAHKAVDYILSRADEVKVDRILLPIGNDFFNVNSMENTTVHGTRQSEDDRWKKTFVGGRRLWVSVIEKCMVMAPVDVVIVPGNHDEERSFYLGDSLECWFENSSDVTVDNSPSMRKYYRWGDCLIGFTHGDKEVKGTLVNIMATEKPIEWSQTKYREWHKGHLHAARASAFQVLDEERGVREWVLPSLVAIDDYHAGKGYSAMRESLGMIWNKEMGKTDMFMFHPGE
jgi:hypothetical protein